MADRAEICPFVNDCDTPCPMSEDIIAISGPCKDDGFGETCAPVAGYGAFDAQYGRLEVADAVDPIVATFTFDEVPYGFPPEDIREQWVGVEVPLRKPDELEFGDVAVSPADAFLSLLRSGRLNAASWFMASGLSLDPLGASWVFQESEGTLNKLEEPISSPDFYGAVLTDEARRAIDSDSAANVDTDAEIMPLSIQSEVLTMLRMTEEPGIHQVLMPTALAKDYWEQGLISSFATFERWLRQMSDRIHFVAVPLDHYGPETPPTTYAGLREGEPEYALWVGSNGRIEAENLLDELGVTVEENLVRLRTTGVLSVER